MAVRRQRGSRIFAAGISNSRDLKTNFYTRPERLLQQHSAYMNERVPIITVIQTRRGSSCLPDKVLMPVQGKPLFLRQAGRVAAARLAGRIIVATTLDPQDDVIEDICRQEGLDCFRGHATDVLDRHYQAALRYPADAVIKIPSDCPLIAPAVIDQVIRFYLAHISDYDFVSNLHPASFPDGNDVEIMPLAV